MQAHATCSPKSKENLKLLRCCADYTATGNGEHKLTWYIDWEGPLSEHKKWSQALNAVPGSDLFRDIWRELPDWIHIDNKSKEI